MDFRKLVELEKYLEVAHHVPGRMRVRFSPLIMTRPVALAAMKEHSELPPAIHSTRVNMSARSVVIEYDPEAIPPDVVEELIEGEDKDRKAELVRNLYEKLMSSN